MRKNLGTVGLIILMVPVVIYLYNRVLQQDEATTPDELANRGCSCCLLSRPLHRHPDAPTRLSKGRCFPSSAAPWSSGMAMAEGKMLLTLGWRDSRPCDEAA